MTSLLIKWSLKLDSHCLCSCLSYANNRYKYLSDLVSSDTLWLAVLCFQGVPMYYQQHSYLYHFTPIDNLPSILDKGLLPRFCAPIKKDIAVNEILERRNILELDKYVPFHFRMNTAFNYQMESKYPDTVFVYIAVERKLAKLQNWLIAPVHPLSDRFTQLYSYKEGVKEIDWDAMRSNIKDDPSESYCRNTRMAECLSLNVVPASEIKKVHVKLTPDLKSKHKIESLLEEYGLTDVIVCRSQ